MPCSRDQYYFDDFIQLMDTRAIAYGPPNIVTNLWQIALNMSTTNPGRFSRLDHRIMVVTRLLADSEAVGPSLIGRIRSAQGEGYDQEGPRIKEAALRMVWEARLYEY
ncbi:hypothetical protein ABW21_db0209433 [Orbilia brochopaga]|nr:hypothetical protein ABW21_db0209433 [Drechslerella brochopaga]